MGGMRTLRAVQEILFLKDPKTSEVVPGGAEAPVSSVGSVQTRLCSRDSVWGGQVNKLLSSASAHTEIRLI